MFVFKAAVTGAGDHADRTADAIAAAGVEVVRHDPAADAALPAEMGDVDLVLVGGLTGEQVDDAADLIVRLDAASPGYAVLAIDSSELPLTELGDITTRPERVIGMHLAGKGVAEIAPTEGTDAQTVQTVIGFAQAIKRQPVICAESPGLVVDRIADDAREIAAEGEGGDAERLALLVAACAVLEEGTATHRDIDVALARGAGIAPPPFMAADEHGLDALLTELEAAADRWGEAFTPPVILRRLVAQGRNGKESGQGFYPYPRPDAEQKGETVLRETRGDVAILWLNNPPMNAVSKQLVTDLTAAWGKAEADGIKAMVIASANPLLFSAGADLKGFTTLDEQTGPAYIRETHAIFTALGKGAIPTIAAVNGLALGGGNELAMSCDIRLAAESALFGQPEIKLGLIPGFGGTQRLAQLVGASRALELNLIGEPIPAAEALESGLVARLVIDHELLDTALLWARRLAEQAPIAARALKEVSANGDLQAGLEAEVVAFWDVMESEDGREGVTAFLEKRRPSWRGR